MDLAKYEAGAALIRNFICNYQGGATYRPGTEFITASKVPTADSPRLLPFIVSTDASYVLEFGAGYIRFIQDGVQLESSPGVAYEVSTPYAQADLALVKYTQSADVMTLTHPSYAPANLTRLTDTTFSYAAITTGPVITPPTFSDITATNGGSYFYGYVATAVDLDGKEESLPSAPGTDLSVIQDETKNDVMKLSLTASADPTSVYNIYKWGPVDQDGLPGSVWGLIGTTKTVIFTDNNIAPDYSKEPPGWGDPFSGGQFESIKVATGGSGYVAGGWNQTPYVPLTISGDGTGAAGFAILSNDPNQIVGVYLTNTGKNYTTATVSASGMSGTGATFTYTFTDPAPLYPACAAYYQQRRVFGGSNLKPETLVMSQTARYDNFNTTPVSLDTDSIVMSLASLEVNTIKSLVPVNYGLLAFTTGSVFLINGGQPYAPITPSSITAQVQVSNGSNDIQPLRVNYDVLYIQNKGNRVRDLSFAWQKQAFTGSDISALASHLFDGFTTAEWTWSEEPFKTVWSVRDDGRMLACTYVPDQEVYAWTRHDTQGAFKSVVSIPEGHLNRVYIIAQRFVGGEWVNYIERMMPTDCCVYDAWYLDSALSLPNPTQSFDLTVAGSLLPGSTVDLTTNTNAGSGVEVLSTPGAGTYTVGAGVTSIQIEGIGAGAPGQSQNFIILGFSGAGGGYAKTTVTVIPGAVYSYYVAPSVPTAVISPTSDTWFGSNNISDPACLCYAQGGYAYFGGGSASKGDFTSYGGVGWLYPPAPGFPNAGGAGGPNGAGGSGYPDGGFGDAGFGGAVVIAQAGADGNPGTELAGGLAGSGSGGASNFHTAINGGAGGRGGLFGAGGGAGADGGYPHGAGAQGVLIITHAVDSGPFTGEPGDVVQFGCTKIRLDTISNPFTATGTVLSVDDRLVVPWDPTGLMFPVPSGTWTLTTPTATVSGLGHLEGKLVSALADGLVVHGLTVASGSVTLPFTATNIVVGLDYTGQIQTLYLNVDGLQQGSMQGNRKFLPGATLRVECTRGLSMGPDFDHLVTPPELLQQGSSVALYTGDAYSPISPDWNTRGEICVQQSDPLPATVLGIVVKVVPGDTGR